MILLIDSIQRNDFDNHYIKLYNLIKTNNFYAVNNYFKDLDAEKITIKPSMKKLKNLSVQTLTLNLYYEDYFLHSFSNILLSGANDSHKIKLFKTYKKFKFVSLNVITSEENIVLTIDLEPLILAIPKFVHKKNIECCICFCQDKKFLDNEAFECCHKDVCINCFLKIKICPLCRAKKKIIKN